MLKKILKNTILTVPLEKITCYLFQKNKSLSVSIDPAIPYLKDKFSNKKNLSVLEIGAQYGDSSEKLISTLNIQKYTIIDPYETYNEYGNDGFNDILKIENDKIFNQTKTRLTPLIANLVFHRKFSNDKELLSKLSNEYFDIIFIDGNHEYKYVLEDLRNYFPLLVQGGVLCGDDFHSRSKKNDWLGTCTDTDRPMVYEAVMQFSEEIKLKFLSFGDHNGYPKTFVFEN